MTKASRAYYFKLEPGVAKLKICFVITKYSE